MYKSKIVFDSGYLQNASIELPISGGSLQIKTPDMMRFFCGNTEFLRLNENVDYPIVLYRGAHVKGALMVDGATYHEDSVFAEGHSFFAKSSNIANNGTVSANTFGNSNYYLYDQNSKYIGGMRALAIPSKIIATEIFSQDATGTTYNRLTLRVDNNGGASVTLSHPIEWRKAIGTGYQWAMSGNLTQQTGSGTTETTVYTGSNITMPAGTYLVGLTAPLSTSRNTSSAHLYVGSTQVFALATNHQDTDSTSTAFDLVTISSSISGAITIKCKSQDSGTSWTMKGYNRTAFFIYKVA